jgi:ferredoxin
MKIKVERPKCISCGSCAAVCPEFFEMEENGMAHLKNSKKDGDGNEELVVKEPGCARDAVEVCPVQIIKVEN